MAQDAYNLGFEYQLKRTRWSASTSSARNLLRTIEDIGTLVNGSEAYIYGNPGEGLAKTAIPTGRTPPFEMPKAKRDYTAVEFTANRRFSNNWFAGRQLRAEPPLRQLPGPREHRRGHGSRTRQRRSPSSPPVSGHGRAATRPARGTSTR